MSSHRANCRHVLTSFSAIAENENFICQYKMKNCTLEEITEMLNKTHNML